jgi:hypothetical protein
VISVLSFVREGEVLTGIFLSGGEANGNIHLNPSYWS